MDKIKKALWFGAGIVFLGVAYIGVVTPGIPWSTPSVIAAYCFGKSSKRWHDWLLNHRLFGPFLRNWGEKRIFPTYGKLAMFVSMDLSLIIIWFTTRSWKAVGGTAFFMFLCAAWAFRYPGSPEEWQRRKAAGEKIGWF